MGKPVAKQTAKNAKAFLASECPLAGMHIVQGVDALGGEATAPAASFHPIELMARAYGLGAGSVLMAKHAITPADILPAERYAAERREHRRRVSELKRNRRVEVGPFVTFYFEMLRDHVAPGAGDAAHRARRRGAARRRARGLQPDDPRRQRAQRHRDARDRGRRPAERGAARLGGIEHKMFLTIAGETVRGLADPTRENTSPEGKASSVQFLKFPLSPAQKKKFRAPGTQVVVGIDHANYGHMAVMTEPVREALARDLE